MSKKTETLEPAALIDIAFEVTIGARPADVWQALTDDIGRWWPAPFYCGTGNGPRRFLLEARPGGRMYEDHGGGDGLLWATVVNVRQQVRIDMTGTVGPAWGGPSTWFGGFELTADGKGTKLRYTQSGFGRVSAAGRDEMERGWRYLLGGCLRAFCEGKDAPPWTDS